MGELVGTSVWRVEDRRFLTGEARYLADVVVPGTRQVRFVRSPHARAAIRRIDVESARRAPGVRAVLTAVDLAAVAGEMAPHQVDGLLAPGHPALAHEYVRFVGDPVVLVVADTYAQAVDAAELVELIYEPEPAIIDMERARFDDGRLVWPELGTNVMHRQHRVYGDPAAAIASAALVVRERIGQHRHSHAPMECRGIIATNDPTTGRLDVLAGHQSPHDLRQRLAAVLGLDVTRVRVRVPDMGGSFGQKSGLPREFVVVAAASVLLDDPIAWIEDRTENLLAAGQAREERADVEAGFDETGRLLAIRVDLVMDLGAYPQVGYPANGYPNLIRALLPAAYRLEHYEFTAELVATNKASYLPYRGPWEIETFVRERVLDIAARRLGVDPVELRRRNLLEPHELARGSCTGVVLAGARQRNVVERAAVLMGEQGWDDTVAAGRRDGRKIGVGVSCYLEPAPVSPSLLTAMGVQAVARTKQEARAALEADGTITVFTSQQPHGQGHETTLAQLVADALDVPIEGVRVVWGDTDIVPFNLVGTGGSRAATLASGAVVDAAAKLRDRLIALASQRLEIAPGDLALAAGAVVPRDAPSRRIAFADLTAPDDDPIEAIGDHLSSDGTWSQAAHCCLAEVDAETGEVTILRYVVVEDCGPSINPMIVDGQIAGGAAQGIGAVLYERSHYAEDGQLLTSTLADYLVPSAVEIPAIEIHHLHASTGEPVPWRGVGEGGAIGSPAAVVSAVEDAVGTELHVQHLVPETLAPELLVEETRSTQT